MKIYFIYGKQKIIQEAIFDRITLNEIVNTGKVHFKENYAIKFYRKINMKF